MKELILISLLALCATSTIRINLDINDTVSRQYMVQNFQQIAESAVIVSNLDIFFFNKETVGQQKLSFSASKNNLYMNALFALYNQRTFEPTKFFEIATCIALDKEKFPNNYISDEIIDCDKHFDSAYDKAFEVKKVYEAKWQQAAKLTNQTIAEFSLPFFTFVSPRVNDVDLKELNEKLKEDFFGNFRSLAIKNDRREFLKDLVDTVRNKSDIRDHREKLNDVLEEPVPVSNNSNDLRDHRDKYSNVLQELLNKTKKRENQNADEPKYPRIIDEEEEKKMSEHLNEKKKALMKELVEYKEQVAEVANSESVLKALQSKVQQIKDVHNEIRIQYLEEKKDLEALQSKIQQIKTHSEQVDALYEQRMNKDKKVNELGLTLDGLAKQYYKLKEQIRKQEEIVQMMNQKKEEKEARTKNELDIFIRMKNWFENLIKKN